MSTGDWLALQLWEYSFVILGLAIFAMSLAAAGALFVALTRRTSIRRSTSGVCAIALGAIVFVVLVFTWTIGAVWPASGPIPFDADAWRSKPWKQWGMAQHMVESGQLLGMRQEDVISLLSTGDGSYPSTIGAGSYMESWRLYRPQELLIPRPPELVISYEDGHVVRAWIQPWSLLEEITHDSKLE